MVLPQQPAACRAPGRLMHGTIPVHMLFIMLSALRGWKSCNILSSLCALPRSGRNFSPLSLSHPPVSTLSLSLSLCVCVSLSLSISLSPLSLSACVCVCVCVFTAITQLHDKFDYGQYSSPPVLQLLVSGCSRGHTAHKFPFPCSRLCSYQVLLHSRYFTMRLTGLHTSQV
jgi:hypothetical protein